MSKTLTFYFDFGSPTSYLAHKRFDYFRATYDVEIDYQPVLLGAIHKATNNHPPASVAAKGLYMLRHDLPRFAARYKVPFSMNKHFPINTLSLMRGAHAAEKLGVFSRYCNAVFDALWIDGLNLGKPEIFTQMLDQHDLNSQDLMELIQDPDIKQSLQETTQTAIELGCFGAPTMFIDDEMYFGQDRLDFIEEQLRD